MKKQPAPKSHAQLSQTISPSGLFGERILRQFQEYAPGFADDHLTGFYHTKF
jgi:hypothetical protein